MKIINPSNAASAKARAKFGRRLSAKDYQSMLKCKKVSEVVSYLKNNTSYSEYLDKVNENKVHRGELETIIRKNIFNELIQLTKYDTNSNEAVTEFLIRRLEIQELSTYISLLSIGQQKDYYFSYPTYLDEYTKLDLKKISLCNTYTDFLHTIKGTVYYEPLSKFKQSKTGRINVPRIEDVLDRLNVDILYKDIVNYKKSKANLQDLFDQINDFTNVHRIYRLKKYFNLKPDEIFSHLRHQGTIPDKTLLEMCECEDAKSVVIKFNNTRQGKRLRGVYDNPNESFLQRQTFYYTLKQLHFSQDTEVVVLSYLFQCEIELNNVIHIIEGVRYNLTPDEILPLLIYDKN